MKDSAELVFDDIGHGAGDEKVRAGRWRGFRQLGGNRGEKRVLALCEGRFDAAAGVVHEPYRIVTRLQPLGGLGEIKLDDFGRARADQYDHPEIGTAGNNASHDAVQLVMHVGQAREVTILDDGGGEAGLRKDHHAGGRLHEMSAGPRADDEKERVLQAPVQPDDRGQAAENFALAALARSWRRGSNAVQENGHGAAAPAMA